MLAVNQIAVIALVQYCCHQHQFKLSFFLSTKAIIMRYYCIVRTHIHFSSRNCRCSILPIFSPESNEAGIPPLPCDHIWSPANPSNWEKPHIWNSQISRCLGRWSESVPQYRVFPQLFCSLPTRRSGWSTQIFSMSTFQTKESPRPFA